jgi:hypothetical protein
MSFHSEEPTMNVTSEQENRESTPLPPPVFNARTEKGMGTWTDLVLPAAPPMYRPFSILDDEMGSTTAAGKKSKTATIKSKDPKKKAEDGMQYLVLLEEKVICWIRAIHY